MHLFLISPTTYNSVIDMVPFYKAAGSTCCDQLRVNISVGERRRGRFECPSKCPAMLLVCRLLFLKLKAQNEREKFAFCSMKGCERIKIKALIPKNAGVSDCTATAYPKFTERAVVDVPMPKKLLGSQLVSG